MRAGKAILAPKAKGCMFTLPTTSRCPANGHRELRQHQCRPCTFCFQPLTFDFLDVPRSGKVEALGCQAACALYAREAMSWPYSQPDIRSLVMAPAVGFPH